MQRVIRIRFPSRQRRKVGNGLTDCFETMPRLCWLDQLDRTQARGEQDEALPRLWNPILCAFDNLKIDRVILQRLEECMENWMVDQLGHIFHRDQLGLEFTDESTELADKTPLGVLASLSALAAIG